MTTTVPLFAISTTQFRLRRSSIAARIVQGVHRGPFTDANGDGSAPATILAHGGINHGLSLSETPRTLACLPFPGLSDLVAPPPGLGESVIPTDLTLVNIGGDRDGQPLLPAEVLTGAFDPQGDLPISVLPYPAGVAEVRGTLAGAASESVLAAAYDPATGTVAVNPNPPMTAPIFRIDESWEDGTVLSPVERIGYLPYSDPCAGGTWSVGWKAENGTFSLVPGCPAGPAGRVDAAAGAQARLYNFGATVPAAGVLECRTWVRGAAIISLAGNSQSLTVDTGWAYICRSVASSAGAKSAFATSPVGTWTEMGPTQLMSAPGRFIRTAGAPKLETDYVIGAPLSNGAIPIQLIRALDAGGSLVWANPVPGRSLVQIDATHWQITPLTLKPGAPVLADGVPCSGSGLSYQVPPLVTGTLTWPNPPDGCYLEPLGGLDYRLMRPAASPSTLLGYQGLRFPSDFSARSAWQMAPIVAGQVYHLSALVRVSGAPPTYGLDGLFRFVLSGTGISYGTPTWTDLGGDNWRLDLAGLSVAEPSGRCGPYRALTTTDRREFDFAWWCLTDKEGLMIAESGKDYTRDCSTINLTRPIVDGAPEEVLR